MAATPDTAPGVGRAAELATLERTLVAGGPRVCFVYGIAGIGKSSLLAQFKVICVNRAVKIVDVDCASMEPTEAGFVDAVGRACGLDTTAGLAVLGVLSGGGDTVLLIDTYEVFRIADPWLRHELLPVLGPTVRVVVAGREPPMLEWSVERGQFGGLEVLPLGPLDDASVGLMLERAGIGGGSAATAITKLCRGHPLALRLAIDARLAGDELPDSDELPRVVHALASAFRRGLDEPARRVVDAAAVPRRITRGVLAAMLGEDDADGALDTLQRLAFVGATADGLRLHEAVQSAIVERLRAIDPERFRRYRTAAWHHLRSATRGVARHELARSTADVLFLIDNPVVREAFFPTTSHAHSVEAFRPADANALQDLWHRFECLEASEILDQWLRRLPSSIRVVRDRSGQVVGCSIVATWTDIPPSLERVDPVLASFASHSARHRLPKSQTTLVLRRWLTADAGEGPGVAQAAAWLDVKRDYFSQRPHLGRVYTTVVDPGPYIDALLVLGFTTFGPVTVGSEEFHLAALDFGDDSVDGWLAHLAAGELGITEPAFLDQRDRTAHLGGRRVPLSPLEFGVLQALAERRGGVVTRVELLERVWPGHHDGSSNVVDVVVRGLRVKAGADAARIETVRGAGYRLAAAR